MGSGGTSAGAGVRLLPREHWLGRGILVVWMGQGRGEKYFRNSHQAARSGRKNAGAKNEVTGAWIKLMGRVRHRMQQLELVPG